MNKNVLCMSYCWSISNGSLSPVFSVSPSCIYFIFVFCCIFLFVVVLFLICFLLYTVNSSQYFSTFLSCFVFSCILFFLFSWCCLFFFVFFSILYPNILLLLKVMLSCGIAIFHSSPTNNTSVKTALIIFNIFTFFIFELLSVLAWAFFNKNHSTVLNTELI